MEDSLYLVLKIPPSLTHSTPPSLDPSLPYSLHLYYR